MNIMLFPVFLVVSLEKNQAFSVHSVDFSCCCFFFLGGGGGGERLHRKKTRQKTPKNDFSLQKKAMTIEKCKKKNKKTLSST